MDQPAFSQEIQNLVIPLSGTHEVKFINQDTLVHKLGEEMSPLKT